MQVVLHLPWVWRRHHKGEALGGEHEYSHHVPIGTLRVARRVKYPARRLDNADIATAGWHGV